MIGGGIALALILSTFFALLEMDFSIKNPASPSSEVSTFSVRKSAYTVPTL